MRHDGMLKWEVLVDRNRRVSDKRGWTDRIDFANAWTDEVLTGYNRCLVQGQDKYVEIWVEKDALSTVFERVAWPYCIRVVVCRGYQSVTFIKNYRDRALKAINQGQTPVILYFGDFDPSGVQMFEATQETLERSMGLSWVLYKRIALNWGDIIEHNLIHNPDAIKPKDTRAKSFIDKYGPCAVELDALHPGILKQLATDAVENEFDMELFEEQREIEAMEREKVESLKEDVQQFIRERMNA
jgi:hypothetical protein